jgi:hypothetical protein
MDDSVYVESMIGELIQEGRLDVIAATANNLSEVDESHINYEDDKDVGKFASAIVMLPVETFATVWRSLFLNYPDLYRALTTREDILNKISEDDSQ